MKIIQKSETWLFDDAGPTEFIHTTVILENNGQFFWAESNNREHKIDERELNSQPITSSHLWPAVSSKDLIYTDSTPLTTYTKGPHLGSYDSTPKLAERIRQEIDVVEILAKQPHKNIANYLGCLVQEGLVKGICFTRYKETLAERLSREQPFEKEKVLTGVRAGIDHLHSLGLVHNDLSLNNIMLDPDDNAIIIDFDSCVGVGKQLPTKRGEIPPGVETSEFGNDLFALQLIHDQLHVE